MKPMILLSTILWSATLWIVADQPYDFRATDAYRQLSTKDKQRLEQVRRDQILLWGALDMYADEHNGNPPSTLDELTPKYLTELPSDPFASRPAISLPKAKGYTPSKGGFGYGYKRGAAGNRAWVIASVGLPNFPYLAERGNIGLYLCKGLWISGINPIVGRAFRSQASGAASEKPNLTP